MDSRLELHTLCAHPTWFYQRGAGLHGLRFRPFAAPQQGRLTQHHVRTEILNITKLLICSPIRYTIRGERDLKEEELDHLDGHKGCGLVCPSIFCVTICPGPNLSELATVPWPMCSLYDLPRCCEFQDQLTNIAGHLWRTHGLRKGALQCARLNPVD